MITDGDSVDIRTFAERKDKPFILNQDRINAFEAFQPRLSGLILDCFYNFFKSAHSQGNPVLKRALSKTASVDEDYLNKVIMSSLENEAEAKRLVKKNEEQKKVKEEEPEMKKSLSGLLDQLNDEESDED